MRDGFFEKHQTTAPRREFNDKSLQRLKEAIKSLPGLEDSLNDNNLNFQDMTEIHVFGYGSLPDQPHYPPDEISEAYLWGYSRDLCCKSARSGTRKFNGLTLGLDLNPEGIVPGAILTYRTTNAEQLCEMLEAFAEREVVKEMPIYKFSMVEIEKQDGSKAMALTCVADKDSRGYVGDGLSLLEKKRLNAQQQQELTLRRKGKIIAEANGFLPKSGKHTTSKSYFDRFVRFPLQNNLVSVDQQDLAQMSDIRKKRQLALYKEQQRMLMLANMVDHYRGRLHEDMPAVADLLEEAEAEQMKSWRAKRAEAHKVRRPPNPHPSR
jgi:cation transport regulator ChaC